MLRGLDGHLAHEPEHPGVEGGTQGDRDGEGETGRGGLQEKDPQSFQDT